MQWWVWPLIAVIVSLASFAVAAYFYSYVKNMKTDDSAVAKWGKLIRQGAFAFLKVEYKILAGFLVGAAVLIFLFLPPVWTSANIGMNILNAVVYLIGATLSGLAGLLGMSIATIANVKAAAAAQKGITPSYMAGFRGGAVMGIAVVGIGLFGASIIYLIFHNVPEVGNIILAFSFGASSLALFAKAGGGIFTKTADIAADLTGKVEFGLPEDDPRNPAVIADNVGDNVGDVAGMGADLFDSNIASIAAALVLAAPLGETGFIFLLGALGLLASLVGMYFSSVKEGQHPGRALNRSTYLTTVLFFVLTLIATLASGYNLRLWGAAMLGLLAGTVIGFTSELFTSDEGKSVQHVAKASATGPAFTIISGFSYGLLSVFPALIGIAVAALGAYKICEPLGPGYALYGIALSAVGMLSIVAMITSNDAYGPIVDNARGLAEMGGLGDDVLEITDQLDAAGNTAKAITKGFSIGAAGLTVIALLAAYQEILVEIGKPADFNLLDPLVFFGVIIGVAVPAVFSAMLMMGVDHNATRLVAEIHRQFDEIPGLREGKEDVLPDYDRCIEIATVGALKELLPAGVMAIVSTFVVGFIGGVRAIGGFLAGNIFSGLLLALLMSNAGGMWDNAKKYVESGNFGGKNSDAHKAAVIGDTVGDPFKDTAGPSINTQITVVSLVASLAATLFAMFSLLG